MMVTAYLKHIQQFCDSKDPDTSLLRTFTTSWFAYSREGAWLNRNGRPYWLNKPHPIKRKNLLLDCHFISKNASPVIGNSDDTEALKLDHTVPIKVLRNELHTLEKPTLTQLKDFLDKYYRVGVLTAEEHTRLAKNGLRFSMPSEETLDPISRYQAAEIEVVSLNNSN